MRHATSAAFAALLLAGCAAPETAPAAPLAAADPFAAPRPLARGDWWDVELVDDQDGSRTTYTIVVAELLPDGYLLGMPEEAFFPEPLLLPAFGFGPVGLDHSWTFLGERFSPLAFPLARDAT